MKKKRAVHEEVINLVHQKRSVTQAAKDVEPEDIVSKEIEKKEILRLKTNAKNFKDDEYCISSLPKNLHSEAGLSVTGHEGFGSNRLESGVCDLVADDSSGMQKQKTVYHWDKRSKKYIKLNNGEHVTASGKIKTENGAKIKGGKTGLYKKWKEKSHVKISLTGTGSEGNVESNLPANCWTAGNRRSFKGGRNRQSVPNANVRSEIKDPEQIRKQRQQKANRITLMKNKSKGKKFGKSERGEGKEARRGKAA